jgi:hypothetical protein
MTTSSSMRVKPGPTDSGAGAAPVGATRRVGATAPSGRIVGSTSVRAISAGSPRPGIARTGESPRCWRSRSAESDEPQARQITSPSPTVSRHAWHRPSRWATPGTRSARIQFWWVVGPRSTVSAVIRPLRAQRSMVSSRQPGRNGFSGSRTNQGPISFCVACRESGSVCAPQRSHRATPPLVGAPQNGQTSAPPALPGSSDEQADAGFGAGSGAGSAETPNSVSISVGWGIREPIPRPPGSGSPPPFPLPDLLFPCQ